MPFRTPLAALICAALASPAFADTAVPDQATDLPRVKVTAIGSSLQPDIAGTTTTIDRESLDRHLVTNIRNLVRFEPGVSAIGTAGRFGLDSFNIRGLSGNRTRIEIDGVSMPASFGASVASAGFRAGRAMVDLDSLRSVDIVRGPASAIYPSDALGGIVSLHTKDPADYLTGGRTAYASMKTQYDSSDRSFGNTATVAGGTASDGIAMVFTHREGQQVNNKGDLDTLGATRTRPDPLGYRSDSVLAKYVHAAPSGRLDRVTVDIGRTATHTDGLSAITAAAGFYRSQDTSQRVRGSIGQDYTFAAGAAADRLDWFAYAQDSRTRTQTQTETATVLRYFDSVPLHERVVGGKLVAVKQLGAHTLSYGVELSRTEPGSRAGGYGVDKRTGAIGNDKTFLPGTYPLHLLPRSETDRYAAFAEDEWRTLDDRLVLTPGLRVDRYAYKPQDDALYAAYNPGFDARRYTATRASPKLGVLYRLTDLLGVYGNYAQGFRPPLYSDIAGAWNEQPIPGFNIAYLPSQDLKAETSRGVELGLRGQGAAGYFSVGAYYNRYRNFIWSGYAVTGAQVPAWAYAIGNGARVNFFYQAVNASKAVIKGGEASGSLHLGYVSDVLEGWTLRGNAAVASGKLVEPGTDGYSPLNTVDPARLVVGLGYDARQWGAELVGTAVRRHQRLDKPTIFRPAGYGTVDLFAWYTPVERLHLYAGVTNLADRKYWDWGNLNGGNLGNLIAGNGANDAGTGGLPADRLTMPGRAFSVSARIDF
jgi:hemoglobin/transferrin/lactoferrin receptor protein